MPDASSSPAPPFNRRRAIVAMSFGTALVVLDNSIAAVALPTIAHALGVSRSASVLVVTVYQIVLLMAVLPMSALGDRIGLKRLYQTGQAVFLVSTVASATASGLIGLLAARAFQALGVAAALSVGTALLRRIYPPDQLARGFGLNGIIIASAGAIAPTLGGFLVALGSWRWVFAAAAPFAVISLVLGTSLPHQPATRKSYDSAGAALSAATFGLLTGGLQAITLGGPAALSATLLIAGVVVSIFFVRREHVQAAPILPVDLLAKADFALPVAAALSAFTGSTIFSLSLPFLLQSTHNLEPVVIGSIMAAWPFTMMAMAPVAGYLVGRVPGGLLCTAGMICTAAGLATMATAPADATIMRLVLPLALGGAGFGLFLAPNSHQIMSAAPHQRSASAGAMTTTTRLIGSTMGAMLLAGFLAMKDGNGSTPSFVGVAFVSFAALLSLCNLKLQTRSKLDQSAVEEIGDGTFL